MTVLPEHVGRTYGPSAPALIDASALKAFAGLLEFQTPDIAEGGIAAPTYAITQTFSGINALVDDPEIALELSHVVHSDQRFEYSRPLVAGDTVTTTTTIEAVSSVAGNTLVTLRSDVADAAGAAVCTAHATLVVRAIGAGESGEGAR